MNPEYIPASLPVYATLARLAIHTNEPLSQVSYHLYLWYN